MTFELKRAKPYKERPPEETVKKIQAILNGLGLNLIEKPVGGNLYFYASILSIVNQDNGQIIFSTYGKGTSPGWASASAWGEMIERIQNLAFYMILIYPSEPEPESQKGRGFQYFPDEKRIELLSSPESGFVNYFWKITGVKYNPGYGKKYLTCVPFIDVFNKKSVYFPFRAMQVIIGSNGMCSGNTREEALVQGISEIFERYVLKSLYLNPFCPPEVPLKYFENTEIGNIVSRLITEQGYNIQIKDCSMDKGYPVLGILIRNNQNQYSFHLGADPCPITALERCFTELYQGGSICFLPAAEPGKNLPYNLGSPFWKRNLSRTITSYTGHWPPAILEDIPSYSFTGFDHPESVSDQDDLSYLLELIKNENRRIFIRDNSFLGHPAYSVYIPGMSEISNFPDSCFSNAYLRFDKYLPVLIRLKYSNRNSRAKMIRDFRKCVDFQRDGQLSPAEYFKFFPSHPVARLTQVQFVKLIDLSLSGIPHPDKLSDHVRDSSLLLNSICAKWYSIEPAEIFQKIDIPDCFNCFNCKFRVNCNFPLVLSAWEKIKGRMISERIDQLKSLYFGNI